MISNETIKNTENLENLDNSEVKDVIIDVKKLNLKYGDKQVLFDVDMPIYKNKVIALIGPSGCGKSSFIRCLNRMNDEIQNTEVKGTIIYEGVNINDLDVEDLRKKIGMVFQRPNPFPMSIYENIAYGPKIHGTKLSKKEKNDLVIDCLKKSALYDDLDEPNEPNKIKILQKSALKLSGGQQQRLCIARCIAVSPEIILMDEPCSALDPISTLKIEDLIKELKKDYTIVIVTHNMQQAKRISDYTGFFMNGNVVEFGKTDELFNNPKSKYTENYIKGIFG
ncbi:phosphate ABC transporter ATP-binding protein PstB [Methanococcus voltae]|uniref:Phosphate ABC transporter, ATPase subunit n=1 Tax=Methanococcus voltae (strain ATCC BAA-1334 / A3) TaxID=456320 RepID=D7DSZ0_METV3|nr:phosphate ABC transporter ATP-binding protein PstB [Methanococcus voltae]MCS3901859.1 phosphate transport system ATP-binding protein [Methanococcus voltae]